jgi:amino acid adenylation domain-containing protein
MFQKNMYALHGYLTRSAEQYPKRVAVVEPNLAEITYGELHLLSDRLRDKLWQMGVRRGDRVGLYLPKSIEGIAGIFGILKTGAAYVPVDPNAPAARNAYILGNCAVKVAIVADQYVAGLVGEMGDETPMLLELRGVGGGKAMAQCLATSTAPPVPTIQSDPTDLAYILYTSGSTGKPKGVMLAHEAATSYVDWCSETFKPVKEDRFSSHAPFHFDLSILDIYTPLKHGASVVLIGENAGKEPVGLAKLIAEQKITSWYSTPSILTLLAQYGGLESYDFSQLRTVLFAGEVFPIKHLRLLHSLLPHPDYYNLYGPTETNVCTYYKLPAEIDPDRTQPFPIGKVCSHYDCKVVDLDGNVVERGEEGELVGKSAGMLQGYWQLPERTATAFLTDSDGTRWYKTGDVVFEDENGDYIFVGRRDRMVKKRGYRIELGEIEAGLYQHPDIEEAAVIALTDPDRGVRIKAFISTNGSKKLSIIAMKQFCTSVLLPYMVPDLFVFVATLPKTSTDKINYQALLNS